MTLTEHLKRTLSTDARLSPDTWRWLAGAFVSVLATAYFESRRQVKSAPINITLNITEAS
jgi:hypothetical protein